MKHLDAPIACGVGDCPYTHTWPASVARHRQAKHGVVAHGRSIVHSARSRSVTKPAAVKWGTVTAEERQILEALAEHWRLPLDETIAELKRRTITTVSGYPEVKRIIADRASDARALARRAEFQTV